MNGSWGITGYNPGCGRRQLNSRLFAGQFTNMRNVSVFGFGGPRVVVNNYADTGFYNDGMSMPKWMQWTMLGGMGMSFLGNIFSAIFGGGGGGKTEGAGGKETKGLTSEQKADLDVYMKLDKVKDKYKSYSPLSDGSFILQHKDGTAEKVGSYDELKAKLEECLSASETPEPTTSTQPTSPTTATNPTTPTNPTTATEPTTATDPTTATEPTTATDPTKPTNPTTETGTGNNLEITIRSDKVGISYAIAQALGMSDADAKAKGSGTWQTVLNILNKYQAQQGLSGTGAKYQQGSGKVTNYKNYAVRPGQTITIPAAAVTEIKQTLGITE